MWKTCLLCVGILLFLTFAAVGILKLLHQSSVPNQVVIHEDVPNEEEASNQGEISNQKGASNQEEISNQKVVPNEEEASNQEVPDNGDEGIEFQDTETSELASEKTKLSKKLEEMSLEDKVAQLFLISPEALTGYEQVTQFGTATEKALQQYPVGGFIYFSGNLVSREQVKNMIQGQQQCSMDRIGLPLFIGIDEEGGAITRIASSGKFGVREFPDMAEIGSLGNADKAYELGDTIGSYLTELGFNLDFAPVADVLTNPENTVVKRRSFGRDAQLVSKMVQAQAKGLMQNHVLACVKHFPGHGATAGDTHEGYAYTDQTWEELEERELVPFIDAIENGIPFIMVGHIALPSVTGTNEPASCSKIVIQEHLREELGYDGIVLTDALQMKAITDTYGSQQAAVKVIQAGADMLLEPDDFLTAYRAILDAVNTGVLTEERIDESVARILQVKERLQASQKEG